MKRCLLFMGLLYSIGFISCRKDVLHWQTATQLTSGTTNRLNKILFINDTLGFIVGGDRFSESDILTTFNGGLSFQRQTVREADKAIYDIANGGNGLLYTIGFDGKLLTSNNWGADWHFRQLDYQPYKSIAVTNTGDLVTIGGISFSEGFIYRLTATGDRQSYDTTTYELNQVRILPNGIGYRCGYGTMGKTTDNGATWTLQSPRRDNFVAMDIHSDQEVWTCGYNGSVYHTTNGGGDWDEMRNGNDLTHPRYHLQDILFLNAQNGYAVGEDGVVIYSDDAGKHWMELDRFTDQTLHSIARCPDGKLLVCGEGGVVFRLEKK